VDIPGSRELANGLESDDLVGFLAGLFGGRNSVPHDTNLETHLYDRRIPRWYQKLLERYERIRVQRKKPDGTLTAPALPDDPKMPLRTGSIVTVDETLEGEFKTLYNIAKADAKDYVHQPVANAFDRFLRNVEELHSRKGAYVFGGFAGEKTLQDFVRQVGRAEIPETPPRNLIVVSHAHWSRQLSFVPTNAPADAESHLSYEDIDRMSAELRIPDEHLQPRAAVNTPPKLMFTGCAFGQAEPFLKKLRNAMNPGLMLVAPKHYFGIARNPDDDSIFIEYMAVEHTAYSTTRLNRAGLITELRKTPKRRDAHDQQIADADWDGWLPLEPWPGGDWFYEPGLTFSTFLWFEVIEQPMDPVPIAVDQATFESDRNGKFKAALAAFLDPTHPLSAAHPFPWWRRFGFSSAAKMVDGLLWSYTFTAGTGGALNTVTADATGYRYALLVPIRAQAPHAPGQFRMLGNYYAPGPLLVQEDYPLPKLPLNAHGADNTKYWKVVEPE